MTRRISIALLLVLVPLVPAVQAGASSAAPAVDLTKAAMVGPGCTVVGQGPAQRYVGSGCAALDLGSAPAPARASDAGTPCTSVVPLIDDRCEAWVGDRYDGPAHLADGPSDLDYSWSVASSPDGKTAYALANSNGATSGYDETLTTLAYDGATGVQKWVARARGPAEGPRRLAASVVADPNGRLVYVAGTPYADGFDCARGDVVDAYDAATGAQVWRATLLLPEDICGSAWTMKVDPTGRTLVLVGRETVADGVANRIIALDTATGDVVWSDESRGSDAAGSSASALAFSPDGSTVYVGGSAYKQTTDFPVSIAWTVTAYETRPATDAPAITWTTRWALPKPDAPASPGNPPADVQVSPDGSRVFMVGGAEGIVSFDIFTLAFDATDGHKLWQGDFDGLRSKIKSSFDSVWYTGALAVSRDGRNVYVSGYSTCIHGVNICSDFETLAYDAASGTLRWEARHTNEQWIEWVPNISVSPDGSRVYVSGEARHFELITARYETVAYDTSNGLPTWTARYTDGYSFWSGAAMSPDGKRIFVTGFTAGWTEGGDSTKYDARTVAYST